MQTYYVVDSTSHNYNIVSWIGKLNFHRIIFDIHFLSFDLSTRVRCPRCHCVHVFLWCIHSITIKQTRVDFSFFEIFKIFICMLCRRSDVNAFPKFQIEILIWKSDGTFDFDHCRDYVWFYGCCCLISVGCAVGIFLSAIFPRLHSRWYDFNFWNNFEISSQNLWLSDKIFK